MKTIEKKDKKKKTENKINKKKLKSRNIFVAKLTKVKYPARTYKKKQKRNVKKRF